MNYSAMPIETFIRKVASDSTVPAGGCATALCGALGAALAEMVTCVTIIKEKSLSKNDDFTALKKKAGLLKIVLLKEIDNDASAYKKLISSYRYPESTLKEKRDRNEVIQKAIIHASRVPLAIAQAALEVMDIAIYASEKGYPIARTDAATGAMIAYSAVMGALCSAQANLSSIKNPAIKNELAESIRNIGESAREKRASIPSLNNLLAP